MLAHYLDTLTNVPVEGGSVQVRRYLPYDPQARARTPLVMVHGGPGNSHANMYSSLNALADTRPFICYDQLGSHFSPAELTEDLMRIERFADEIERIAQALDLAEFILLGASWGSAVSVEYALTFPERVRAMVLSGPHLSTPRWVADCSALLERMPEDIRESLRRCEAEGRTDSEEYRKAERAFSDRHLCRMDPWPASLDWSIETTNTDVYMTMWGPSEFTCTGLLKDMDHFPRLHELKMPVLMICGEHDTATPETVREACALMPDARMVVIPNSGHASLIDKNGEYIEAALRFLEGL